MSLSTSSVSEHVWMKSVTRSNTCCSVPWDCNDSRNSPYSFSAATEL